MIFALTALPGNEFPDLGYFDLFSFDKFVHAFFFAILSYNIAMGQYKQYRFCSIRYRCAKTAVLISVVYGILLEILQQYVWFDRTGDVLDVLANTIGSILGVMYFKWIFKKQMELK